MKSKKILAGMIAVQIVFAAVFVHLILVHAGAYWKWDTRYSMTYPEREENGIVPSKDVYTYYPALLPLMTGDRKANGFYIYNELESVSRKFVQTCGFDAQVEGEILYSNADSFAYTLTDKTSGTKWEVYVSLEEMPRVIWADVTEEAAS